MTTKDLFERYKEEFCSKCKNKYKEFTLCNITICNDTNIKEARCNYYERDNGIESNK